MTIGKNKKIRKHLVPELEADQHDYQRLLKDMVENAGPLIPDPNWLVTDDRSQGPETYDKQQALTVALSDEHYSRKVSKMMQLMKAWVGGAERATKADIKKYYRFLEHSDVLELWKTNVESTSSNPASRQDLGSIMDLNLIYTFSYSPERKVTRLLEIGGGYGRLAEAAFNIFGHSLRYVMIDSVPASLHYAYKYLSHACPDAKIAFYENGGHEIDLDNYDIVILPSWHFHRWNTSLYDVCVNIESMQEMNQYHVDYYLQLFDSNAADGATIYLSNAHDYYFRGSFTFPGHWQKLVCTNTPRSWTLDHPTEIFRKVEEDCSSRNRVIDSIYSYGLWLENDPEEFVCRKGIRQLLVPALKATCDRRYREGKTV
jgi:putative sugar O-methyltransferase